MCEVGSGETSWNRQKLGLNLIWLPFIYKKWNIKFFHKNFDIQLGGFSFQNLTLSLKRENFMTSKYRHVGCQSRGKRFECWRCVLRFSFG